MSSRVPVGFWAIGAGTATALAVAGTLSLVTYRAAVRNAADANLAQQLAIVRTAAAGIQGDLRDIAARGRQFAGLPSVQNLDVSYIGLRLGVAFGSESADRVLSVARFDTGQRIYAWTADGRLVASGEPTSAPPGVWEWLTDPANQDDERLVRPWWIDNTQAAVRTVVRPVWRTALSAEVQEPAGDFNGVLAVVVDLDQLMQAYLGPALTELAGSGAVAGLGGGDFGIAMGADGAQWAAATGDVHDHDEPFGTSILDDAQGRRLHAWATLSAAGETWVVTSSTEYDRVAKAVAGPARLQMALSSTLLLGVPIAGWLLIRRERRAQQGQLLLERQLAESQRLEAIGRLAGGVAHDFNNLLTAIAGYADLLLDRQGEHSPDRASLIQIGAAAERAAQLTRQLLMFSRRQAMETAVVDLNGIVRDMLPMLPRLLGEDVHCETDLSDAPLLVNADRTMLDQILLNLAVNARDAMPNGGRLVVETRCRLFRAIPSHADGPPGAYAGLSVADSGEGIAPDVLPQIFEPFFTTKPAERGTGLGLATVFGVVKQHRGWIDVESHVGKGTRFDIWLPAATGSVAASRASPPGAQADADGGERVLVVEDDAAIRSLVQTALHRHGYRVEVAGDGVEALRVWTAAAEQFDLLVTDLVMPRGIDGRQLAETIRVQRPNLPVLFTTGYAQEFAGRRVDVGPNEHFLGKPFRPTELVATIRRALAEARR